MHDEVVVRRKWLTDEQFLDLLGATNLIPGPNSTEMAIHIGYLRAGWAGLLLGGFCFIAPATLIVLALAWLYVRFGATPQAAWLLYGIKPVVIAIIAQALWTLGGKALKNRLLALFGAVVFVLYFLGVNEIALLFVGGLIFMLITNFRRIQSLNPAILLPLSGIALTQSPAPFTLPLLFLTFLKIGSVLYGSGYVLLAFLRARLRPAPGLADRSTTPRRGRHRTGHAGSALHRRDLHRISARWDAGRAARHTGDFSPILCLRRDLESAHPEDPGLCLGKQPAGWR